ncbi:hypothetical protein [Sphingomonas azotifigens]|uniref:hypothetical protein n=1 Tax=Sphingomonas azotifigens TaxID=330920 RepID=UPI000A041447|nr:hypothetical protein [Sphingomonas azotifigens]
MRIAIITLGALALAGCAQNAEYQAQRDAQARRELASALGDRVPGKPQDCISPGYTDGPQIIDTRTLLYRQGARLYRNTLAAECPSLAPLTTVIVEMRGSQLCRNDQFRVLTPGTTIPSGYCRLGNFTPYTRPKGG